MGKEQAVVLFEVGSPAEYMGGRPPEHDVFEILSQELEPFTIISTHSGQNKLHAPRIAYHYRPHDEKRTYVWLANNDRSDREKFSEPIVDGTLKVDTDNKRILYEPGAVLPLRDSYRARGLGLSYNGRLVDILEIFRDKGFSFVQITGMSRLRSQLPVQKAFEGARVEIKVQREFSSLTGFTSWEAYQIEGNRSLEQILAGDNLPSTQMGLDVDSYMARLKADWKV